MIESTIAFQILSDIIIELCQWNRDRFQLNQPLANSIAAYVQQNYNNNQISLTMVANEFGITEIYLSKFFKEKQGENFSKYVERLRLEKSKELVETTDYSISEISQFVGYNSAQVFNRAYKKFFGITPRGKG